jgi:hypothetical protein
MAFLPSGYETPTVGNKYMKFKVGENKFRAVSDAIVGFEYWTQEGDKKKPVRVHEFEEVPAQYRGQQDTKAFWAFLVYDYSESAYKILEITQKSIMGAISTYVDDSDWGDPKGYDIVVKKSGVGKETEYATSVKPAKKFEAPEAIPTVNLNALYDGADPFSGEQKPVVKRVMSEGELDNLDVEDILKTDEEEPKKTKKDKLIDDLINLFTEMGKSSDEMVEYIQKKFGVDSPSELSEVKLDTIVKAIRMKIKVGKEPKEVPVMTLAEALDRQDLGENAPTFDKGKK